MMSSQLLELMNEDSADVRAEQPISGTVCVCACGSVCVTLRTASVYEPAK